MSDFGPMSTPGTDPRSAEPGRPAWDADARPIVARRPGGSELWLLIGGPVVLGAVVLTFLANHRTNHGREAATATSASPVAAAPIPSEIASFQAASRAQTAPQIAANPPVLTPVVSVSPAPAMLIASGAPLLVDAEAARLKAPAMVVDLAAPPPAVGPGASSAPRSGAQTGAAAGAAAGAGGAAPAMNNDEQFAQRVGAAEPERAEATVMHNLGGTIAQGTMIPGVLETALDSDLPGYARAVVSKDVRSFDGTAVLVPRGSRVIGQYKSAVAQGQSRAFVIWTRILRPDGASIQIGSSGTDPLGRAGLAGSVNRHFLEEFGGAILLSVVNAGVSDLGRQPSTEVVIGSASQATTLAGSAFLPSAIPPTIKVPQGAPIRIFVARDLDFSPAGAVGR
jgi:type IV secretory pathway VirB10-like protein